MRLRLTPPTYIFKCWICLSQKIHIKIILNQYNMISVFSDRYASGLQRSRVNLTANKQNQTALQPSQPNSPKGAMPRSQCLRASHWQRSSARSSRVSLHNRCRMSSMSICNTRTCQWQGRHRQWRVLSQGDENRKARVHHPLGLRRHLVAKVRRRNCRLVVRRAKYRYWYVGVASIIIWKHL